MSVRPGAWQRVLALAPLLLVLASLPSQVLMRCQMDGQLRESCCCPRTDKASPADATVAAAGCCSSVTSVSQLPVVRTSVAPDAAPTVIAVALSLPAPQPRAIVRSVASAPAREGPPILLLKQAFLI